MTVEWIVKTPGDAGFRECIIVCDPVTWNIVYC